MTTCTPTLSLSEEKEEAQWSRLSALTRRPHVWAEMTHEQFFTQCQKVFDECPNLRSEIESLSFLLKDDGAFNVGYGFRQGDEPDESIALSWIDLRQQLQAEIVV